ncbi:MAG: hypothetical protein EXQ90_01240 [Rhodospirillales bacterium]|nr:hypothetical protein [Rhodospirillales bacterium]
MMTAPYIYLVQIDVPASLDAEVNRVYDDEHIPHLIDVPGCLSCTRYRLVGGDTEGAPRFTAMWGMSRPDITGLYGPNGQAWKAATVGSQYDSLIRPHVTQRSHHILERIAPPRTAADENYRATIAAPYLFLVQLDIPKHLDADLNRIYDTEHVPHLMEVPGCLGCARFMVVGGDEGAPRFTAMWGLLRPDITGIYGPNGKAWANAAKGSEFNTKILPHLFNRRNLILERITPPLERDAEKYPAPLGRRMNAARQAKGDHQQGCGTTGTIGGEP